jgi:hypothetical protein
MSSRSGVQYEIHELKNGFVIEAPQHQSWVTGILAGIALGGLVAFAAAPFFGLLIATLLTVLGFGLGLFGTMRTRTSSLKIENLEFSCRGRYSGFYKQRVSLHDVRWLEFREESGASDNPERPCGLYAVLRRGSVCVIPGIGEDLTNRLIDEIETRFPDQAKRWRADSPFGDHFTTLGIDQPK